MAPETRIGLVVGLAFIICFAVILANKGQSNGSMTAWQPVADTHTKVHPTGWPVTVPSEAPSRLDRTDRRPRDVQSLPDVSSDASSIGGGARNQATRVPTSGATVLSAKGADLEARFAASGPFEELSSAVRPPGQDSISAAQDRDVSKPTVRQAIAERNLTARSPDVVEDTTPAVARHPESHRPLREPGGSASTLGAGAVERLPAESTAAVRHTVVKGDTLSKTARTYYGRPSSKIVRAIYEANRSVLSGPDLLPLGTVLLLPPVDGVAPRSDPTGTAEGRTTTTGRRTSPSAPPPSPPLHWYQIRKRDRYASIAREQLGDESRWREIYELNRAIFPDADRIREGVRIRLPVTRLAAAGGT